MSPGNSNPATTAITFSFAASSPGPLAAAINAVDTNEVNEAVAQPSPPRGGGGGARGRAAVFVRLTASLALLASSAFLILSSNENNDHASYSSSHIRSLEYVRGTETLLSKLALISNTKSVTQARKRAQNRLGAKSVTPVYWHIYKAGGTSVKSVLIDCLDLTTAVNAGVLHGHDKDTEIGLMKAGGKTYVNVDTITLPGISRAAQLGLAQSNLADAIVTPLPGNAVRTIFTPHHRALLFAIFRHPVDRLVSQYYYLQSATWEDTYNPAIARISLGEYARMHANRMTHQLLGDFGAPTEDGLELAKEILRERTIVGLQSDVENSVRRFVGYFGWERSDHNSTKYEECFHSNFPAEGHEGGRNRHSHPRVEVGSAEWNEVATANEWDIRLYEYAVEIYGEQGRTMLGKSEDDDDEKKEMQEKMAEGGAAVA